MITLDGVIQFDGTLETYKAAMREFIKLHNLRRGSFVQVIKRPKKGTGWPKTWNSLMTSQKGQIKAITDIYLFGFALDYNGEFPFYSCDPIEPSLDVLDNWIRNFIGAEPKSLSGIDHIRKQRIIELHLIYDLGFRDACTLFDHADKIKEET